MDETARNGTRVKDEFGKRTIKLRQLATDLPNYFANKKHRTQQKFSSRDILAGFYVILVNFESLDFSLSN